MNEELPILEAYDADGCGCSDETVLRALRKSGPPFIFGSNVWEPVGTRFLLAGQPFVSIWHATLEEYLQREKELGLNRGPRFAALFFEAATD